MNDVSPNVFELLPLNGRTALVTGGSRGIGRAIALTLASHGARVAINYRKDEDAAQEVVELIKKGGGESQAYAASVDDEHQDNAMIEQIVADFGALDLLVNNAGIASSGRSVCDTPAAELARVMSVHAFAPFYLTKAALPHLRKAGRGDIIMISSVATLSHAAGGAAYNMAKNAMEALAYTLAKEEREHGIRTNIVAPGLTVTEMGKRLVRAARDMDIADLDAAFPFGRVSTPEDVAKTVAFLVSDANGYINGHKINIDGGGAKAQDFVGLSD